MSRFIVCENVACGAAGAFTTLLAIENDFLVHFHQCGFFVRGVEITLTGGSEDDPPFLIWIGNGAQGSGTDAPSVMAGGLYDTARMEIKFQAESLYSGGPNGETCIAGFVRPNGGHFFWSPTVSPWSDIWAFHGQVGNSGLMVTTRDNPVAGVTAAICYELDHI